MRPGLKTLITGVALFFLGGFVIPFLLILPVFLNEAASNQFLIPGSKEITVERSGRYYLWNDFQTVFEGKSFSHSENLPHGLDIAVTDESGNRLVFNSNLSISSMSGSSSKNSIGYVDIRYPSTLLVSVTGGTEERVFSFSQSIFPKMFLAISLGGAASLLMAFVGFGIGIWGIIKLVSNTKEKPSVTPYA
jgi:hypothetical protein